MSTMPPPRESGVFEAVRPRGSQPPLDVVLISTGAARNLLEKARSLATSEQTAHAASEALRWLDWLR